MLTLFSKLAIPHFIPTSNVSEIQFSISALSFSIVIVWCFGGLLFMATLVLIDGFLVTSKACFFLALWKMLITVVCLTQSLLYTWPNHCGYGASVSYSWLCLNYAFIPHLCLRGMLYKGISIALYDIKKKITCCTFKTIG